MNSFSRHKNTIVLATVLLAQFLALAVQVKRQTAEGPVRMIRLLAVNIFTPFERLFIYSGESVRGVWGNYIDLRSVRRENERLKAESQQMRMDRAREQEEARQARRIQALLGFKEQWIDTTVAAQVIGTSGTESSRVLYLDKGTKDGIHADMPVITPDGVVGKVLTAYGETAQVLMISDPTSGVGATLVTSRLQGIVKGTSTGEVQLNYIMGDEAVQNGEALVTSGGDRVFPKGLPLGTVANVSMGRNLFLDIKLKPAVDLNRLEEVLVITEQKPRSPDTAGLGPIRASDILAQHLPGVPQTPAPATGAQPPSQSTPSQQTAPAVGAPAQGKAQNSLPAKPQTVAPSAGAGATKPQVTRTAVTPAGAAPQKPSAPKLPKVPAQGVAQRTLTAKPPTGASAAGSGTPKAQAAKTAVTPSGAPKAVQKPSAPKSSNSPAQVGAPRTLTVKPPTVAPAAGGGAPKAQGVKTAVTPAGAPKAVQKPSAPKSPNASAQGVVQKASTAKPQTVAAGKSAGKPAVVPTGAHTSVQKPAAPKTAPKQVSPNAGGVKPKPTSQGTNPQ